MRRIFICTTTKFPRGEAGANYVEYLALALKRANYEVCVLGINNEAQTQRYQEILFVPFSYGKKKEKKIFDYYFLGKKVADYLSESGLNEDDFVIFYTKNPFYMRAVLALMKQVGCHGAACVVEWHQAFQYKGKALNPEYHFQKKCFERYYVETGNIIAISELLYNEYKDRGCNVICIPIMANTEEYVYARRKHPLREILISGLEEKKDDPYVMLQAFELLSDKELERIHINVTGISRTKFEKLVEKINEKVVKRITVHKWMNYEELVELYRSMDFLLIARQDNIVTQANFPSKVPEGLTYGIIPIVTRVGDYTSKYLNDTNSIIFEKCTVEECAIAIKKAIRMNEEECYTLSKNARMLAEEKFNYTNWTSLLKSFVENN